MLTHDSQPQVQGYTYNPELTGFMPPHFRANYYGLERGKEVDTSRFAPLLTAEQASSEMRFPVGALQTVVRLPWKQSMFSSGETPPELASDANFPGFLDSDQEEQTRRMNATTIFCFEDIPPSRPSHGRHSAPRENVPAYYVMGLEQIGQLRAQVRGRAVESGVKDGVLKIRAGETVSVGRGSGNWLPGVGRSYPDLAAYYPEMREAYSAVSHLEASLTVSPQGNLVVSHAPLSRTHYYPSFFVGLGRPYQHGRPAEPHPNR